MARGWKTRMGDKEKKRREEGRDTYTAHVAVSSGAPGTNRMKAPAFVRHNPISLSRKIFFKRRK